MRKVQPLGLLSLLVALAAAPAARAGDPQAAAFKQAAKEHVGAIKAKAKDVVKELKTELGSASKGFASGQLSADLALSIVVAAVTQQRDALEDMAFERMATLAADGHQILVAAGSPPPGPDFQAGAGGAWDEALADTQAVLDDADDDVRAACASFLKALAKGAKKQKLDLDVRAQIPPHDEAFWSLVPPAAQEDAPAEGTDADPLHLPQVLIAVRGAAPGTPDGLRLGVRTPAASLDVHAASVGGESVVLGTLLPNATGTTTANLALDTLAHPDGFVVAHLNDGILVSPRVAVSAPSLLAPDPNADEPLVAFKKSLKASKKTLSKSTSEVLGDFKDSLTQSSHMLQAGGVSPDHALKAGFVALRGAREGVGVAWNAFVDATADAASLALAGAGVADTGLPSDFQPDVAGLGATAYATALKQLDSRQKQITTAYDGFVGKIVKAAAKMDIVLDANRVLGRTASFAAPMVSGAATPPLLPSTAPRLPDGMLIALPVYATDLDGPLDLTLLFDIQADFGQLGSVSASSFALPAALLTDFGSFPLGPGGTQSHEAPLGQDPALGWILRTGATLAEPAAETVLTPPDLSD